ncbi:orotidine-5'-phosphate decarboxylase [Desertibacillus haloalkaliphilus]|uniref:orotidine-5'-phosphate decarboxylase n=1 Tax=Desertibacillus haloalkaliphilus TaxID=1328930 RepID=UPI001C2530AB|nr:orotidine-5'-phosphate decarboxylase [Desertibacillus haloalkaliphilus]MBU8907078.1 orotidine-5'-phosphate decarboxylase [Desertibacillus haloalkaliphilus]
MTRPIIIALDFSSKDLVDQFLRHFEGESIYVKVGMELFYSCGPQLIYELKHAGHDIFLDLKLHDIPNTVKRAMQALARLDVDLVNVHAAGGSAMMRAALEGLDAGTMSGKKRPSCIAVTQLTSTTERVMQSEIGIDGSLEETVESYARLAEASGLDGVVCSPLEVPSIQRVCPPSFLTITPGIRLAGDAKGDQKRVTTPRQARELGSYGIVVGRSITAASDPREAYDNVKREWECQS